MARGGKAKLVRGSKLAQKFKLIAKKVRGGLGTKPHVCSRNPAEYVDFLVEGGIISSRKKTNRNEKRGEEEKESSTQKILPSIGRGQNRRRAGEKHDQQKGSEFGAFFQIRRKKREGEVLPEQVHLEMREKKKGRGKCITHVSKGKTLKKGGKGEHRLEKRLKDFSFSERREKGTR